MNTDKKRLPKIASSEIGLELASLFFLEEAFRYIHDSFLQSVKYDIFEDYVEAHNLGKHSELDEDNPSVLVVDSEWFEEITANAENSGHKLDKKKTVSSVELIGHVVNLAIFVECILNRQLYYMRKSGGIEEQHYVNLDRTEVISKILFVFKDEVLSRKLSVSRIKHLFRLRNQAVHYKDTSTQSISITVEELLGIWQEIHHLLNFTNLGSYEKLDFANGRPTQEQFDRKVNTVTNKWIA